MGRSKTLTWCAVLATASVIVCDHVAMALYQHATTGCDDQRTLAGAIFGAATDGLAAALPWYLILGAQLVRLRYPATTALTVVSVAWILIAGMFALLVVGYWPGLHTTQECLDDDWDSFNTEILVSWILTWPCALFFMASAAFAWEHNSGNRR